LVTDHVSNSWSEKNWNFKGVLLDWCDYIRLNYLAKKVFPTYLMAKMWGMLPMQIFLNDGLIIIIISFIVGFFSSITCTEIVDVCIVNDDFEEK